MTDLRAQVNARRWYHTIELPGGVVTPGEYDLRRSAAMAALPASLDGKRGLDVGTHDGFWAFEMERRRASGVVAIDVDDPARLDWPGTAPAVDAAVLEAHGARRQAFQVAHDALGSSVQRRDLSVYELSVEAVGTFDFAVLGTLLHHLRDPIGALMAVRRVVTGDLLLIGAFSISKSLLHPRQPVAELTTLDLPFWELPNLAGLRRQVAAAGWQIVRSGRPFLERYGAGWTRHPLPHRPSQLPRHIVLRFGAPHVWLVARPLS